MYVQCEKCKTEYDFDDALVSEKGTTVKCTQCSHQFKVRRTEAGGDRWTVTTVSGKTLVFTSLRELQKAIIAKQVGRSDSLARGSGSPRLLGAIAELEPFFEGRRASVPPGAAEPLKRPSSRPPPPPGAQGAALTAPKPRGRIDTLRPPVDGGLAVPPPHASVMDEQEVRFRGDSPMARSILTSPHSLSIPDPPAVPQVALQSAPIPSVQPQSVSQNAPVESPQNASFPNLSSTAPMVNVPQFQQQLQQPVVVQSAPQQRPEMSSPLPPPAVGRGSMPSYYEEAPPEPPRRRVGWIVAVVLLIGASVLGVFVIKPYLATPAKPAGSALPPLDPKVQQLLTEGERAFADGNLDEAKDKFVMASALAEKDPRVLLDVARVAAARADIAWLKVRLLPPGDAQNLEKSELDKLAAKAKESANAAHTASPDDPAATRALVDALRIGNDIGSARPLVTKLADSAAQPETAYVLAALDLAEPSPPSTQVIDRLRAAVGFEGNLGRARAALVYALARSGNVVVAKQELEKLVSLPRQHPLLADLRAFVDSASQPVSTVDGGVASIAVSTLPTNGGTGPVGGGGDPRSLLTQADAARTRGDYQKAKELYGRVIEANPNDSEALTGLGDVSYAQHDYPNAQTYYKRALAVNGSFIGAIVGLADTLYDMGDKPSAQKYYKEVVERFPESAYPARVKQRAEQGPAQTGSE